MTSAIGLERWFAKHAETTAIDLSNSGAPARALSDLLSLASPGERAEVEATSLGYGAGEGTTRLRCAIASRYTDIAVPDVAATCGAIEALQLVLTALVSAGDEVIVQRPSYPAARDIARGLGARVVPWDVGATGAPGHALDSLVRLLTPRTRVVVMAQPTAPIGTVLEAAEIDEIARILTARDVWLLSDEVYRELALDRDLRVPSAAGRGARVVALGDVSKPFGLGGLRIGWLITVDPGLRAKVAQLRDHTTLSVPTISDALATLALRHAEELLIGPLAAARANLARLRALGARDRLSFVTPRAGMTAFARVPDAAAFQRQLQEHGVLVVPGGHFGDPDRVRIGLGVDPHDFAVALERIGALLR